MDTNPSDSNKDETQKQKRGPESEIFHERFRRAAEWVDEAIKYAHLLGWLGKASEYPAESEHRRLAELRDDIDRAFLRLWQKVSCLFEVRLRFTFLDDLLITGFSALKGDGVEALRAMRRSHELFGDETTTLERAVEEERLRLRQEGLSDVQITGQKAEIEARARREVGMTLPETMPDIFVWEAYQRVCDLESLAEEYPKHIGHAAGQMPGWPMVVTQHLDFMPEFRRIAERLRVGKDYALDVSARKRRGTQTPMLKYVASLLEQLATLQTWLHDPICLAKGKPLEPVIARFWEILTEEKAAPELVEILKPTATLEPLTRDNVRAWTNELLTPLIMLRDAKTPATCEEPALQNIWRHRAVKSEATFRSRLQSAVQDTLKRFARAKAGENGSARR